MPDLEHRAAEISVSSQHLRRGDEVVCSVTVNQVCKVVVVDLCRIMQRFDKQGVGLALIISKHQIAGIVVIARHATNDEPRGFAAADEVFS